MKKNLLISIFLIFALLFSACSGNLHEPLEELIASGTSDSGGSSSATPSEGTESGNSSGSNSGSESEQLSEIYFYFKAAEGTYPVWLWDNDGNGGEVYTKAKSWPGDNMTFLCRTAQGDYIYKYFVTETNLMPTNLIIGGDSKVYEGGYVNHGLYYAGAQTIEVISDESVFSDGSN